MFNKEYVEKYNQLTGRDLAKDTEACFKEFFELSKYLEKYGMTSTRVALTLWHNGVTVESVAVKELTQNEWQVLTWLGEQLHARRVKEMPLVAAGIVSIGDEN